MNACQTYDIWYTHALDLNAGHAAVAVPAAVGCQWVFAWIQNRDRLWGSRSLFTKSVVPDSGCMYHLATIQYGNQILSCNEAAISDVSHWPASITRSSHCFWPAAIIAPETSAGLPPISSLAIITSYFHRCWPVIIISSYYHYQQLGALLLYSGSPTL